MEAAGRVLLTAISVTSPGSRRAIMHAFSILARTSARGESAISMRARYSRGMSPRQYLSAGMGAVCQDSEGNPFNGSWVVDSSVDSGALGGSADGSMGVVCVGLELVI